MNLFRYNVDASGRISLNSYQQNLPQTQIQQVQQSPYAFQQASSGGRPAGGSGNGSVGGEGNGEGNGTGNGSGSGSGGGEGTNPNAPPVPESPPVTNAPPTAPPVVNPPPVAPPTPYQFGTIDVGWGMTGRTPYEGWEGNAGDLARIYDLFPDLFGKEKAVDAPPSEVNREYETKDGAPDAPGVDEFENPMRPTRAEWDTYDQQMADWDAWVDEWVTAPAIGGPDAPPDPVGGSPDLDGSPGSGAPDSGGSPDSGSPDSGGGGDPADPADPVTVDPFVDYNWIPMGEGGQALIDGDGNFIAQTYPGDTGDSIVAGSGYEGDFAAVYDQDKLDAFLGTEPEAAQLSQYENPAEGQRWVSGPNGSSILLDAAGNVVSSTVGANIDALEGIFGNDLGQFLGDYNGSWDAADLEGYLGGIGIVGDTGGAVADLVGGGGGTFGGPSGGSGGGLDGGGGGASIVEGGKQLVQALGTALFTDESYDSIDWFSAAFSTLGAAIPVIGPLFSDHVTDKLQGSRYAPDETDFSNFDQRIEDRIFDQMTGRLDPNADLVPEGFGFKPRWDTGQWAGDRWQNNYQNSFSPEAVYYSPDDLSVAPSEYNYINVGNESNNPLGQSDWQFARDWQSSDARADLFSDFTDAEGNIDTAAARDNISIEDRVNARLGWAQENDYRAFEWGTDMSFMDDWQRSGIEADFADWKAANPDEFSAKQDYQEDVYIPEWFYGNTDEALPGSVSPGQSYVGNELGQSVGSGPFGINFSF